MANSALTGNTSGLASATSPGLVGITTQTFAGKKTLDGGALIKGDTSGVAIAAGYVGEIVSSTSTSNLLQSSPTLGNYYYITGAPAVTLSKGIYSLTAYAIFDCAGTYTTANVTSSAIQLYNNTASSQIQLIVGSFNQAAITALGTTVTAVNTITISVDSTVIQLRAGMFLWSGTPTTTALRLRGDITPTQLTAVRIG